MQQATQLQDQVRHRLKHNIGLSRAQMAGIDERLQACAGRLGELRDWRRWGAHQAREQLCATAESLVGLEAEPTEIAQRIQQVREAWKELDHHEGAAPKGSVETLQRRLRTRLRALPGLFRGPGPGTAAKPRQEAGALRAVGAV